MKKWLIFLLIIPAFGLSQTSYKIEATRTVFNNLVQAYANGKGAPDLEIIPLSRIPVIAEYYTTKEGNPIIRIDQRLIDICFSLGIDSINALAFVLSHELSHYYRDDNWCMDYAKFKYKTNPAIAKKMKEASEQNKEKEAIADKEGLLHAGIAGYYSFGVFDRLIDSIYKKYKLQSNLDGYPTKDYRKEINKDAQNDAQRWLSVFDAGTILIHASKYQEAIDCFTFLSKKFPSREVFNNLGTAQLLWAIKIKPSEAIEYIYPVEIDPQSRLNNSLNSSRAIDSVALFEELLNMALQNFDKAKQIDPQYKKVNVNLACVYDLLENFDFSTGYSKKINTKDPEYISALEIRAIAYAHQNKIEDAKNCFLEIQRLTNDSNYYNYKMFLFGNENLVTAEKFKNNWTYIKKIDSATLQNLNNEIINNSNYSKPDKFTTEINGKLVKKINSFISEDLNKYSIETKEKIYRLSKKCYNNNSVTTNQFLGNITILSETPLLFLQKTNTNCYLIISN
jgi:tetratricopeptide (TPR) repeat protein